jgi:hypothetical protein
MLHSRSILHARWGGGPRLLTRGRLRGWAPAAFAILGGAALLWAIAGVGFVNYDTLYGLVWAQQLTRGEIPEYGLPIAPTPHPLVEALGVPLAPLGASASATIVVALGFLALSACGWVIYRLGSVWFGRAAGALAALILLTRVPVLSYGVRAYVDVPYLLLVLSALLVESRRSRAGAPVLVLLGLAGLLRPEAWAFSGIYWVYLVVSSSRSHSSCASHSHSSSSHAHPSPSHPHSLPSHSLPSHSSPSHSSPTSHSHPLSASRSHPDSARTHAELARLALLAGMAPAIWVLSDLLVTGNAMWSLTHTKQTATVLGRASGIADVPQYIPRRIGEVLRPAVLAGAALGGALSLAWLGRRARPCALAGVIAVGVFAALAAFGLPIDTRYAFLASAILCVFCGAGVFGWSVLPKGDWRRRPWMAVGAIVLLALLATLPGQVRSAHKEFDNLAHQQSIQDDLLALVDAKQITLRCGPVGVPNHAPIPLLALYLKARPGLIVSAEAQPVEEGTYVDPASMEVEKDYILDPRDPHSAVSIPPGFIEAHSNRSWLIFERCS